MKRLLAVELLRFRSRRAMKVLGFGSIALVMFIMLVQFLTHSKADAADVERFRAERSARYEQARADMATHLAQLEADPNFPPQELQRMRAGLESTSREEFIEGQEFGCPDCRSKPGDDYIAAADLKDGVKAVAFIFAFAAFLMGATAAGAEWNAGTMQSLLFWESRRVRVILAKVAALVLSVVVLAIVGQVILHALGYVVGSARGSAAGMTGEWLGDQAVVAARGLGLAAFAACIGFALAFATRNSGFALGVAFVYFAILQNLLIAWKPWLIRYVLVGPMAAWLDGGFRFTYSAEGVEKVINLSTTFGGLALLAYSLVAVALAALWFRSRDVT